MTGQWFSTGNPVSSNNKTDCYDISKILLKVTLNTITDNEDIYLLCETFIVVCGIFIAVSFHFTFVVL